MLPAFLVLDLIDDDFHPALLCGHITRFDRVDASSHDFVPGEVLSE